MEHSTELHASSFMPFRWSRWRIVCWPRRARCATCPSDCATTAPCCRPPREAVSRRGFRAAGCRAHAVRHACCPSHVCPCHCPATISMRHPSALVKCLSVAFKKTKSPCCFSWCQIGKEIWLILVCLPMIFFNDFFLAGFFRDVRFWCVL